MAGSAALRGRGDERFGQGSAFQKTESGAGMEFDVGHGGWTMSFFFTVRGRAQTVGKLPANESKFSAPR